MQWFDHLDLVLASSSPRRSELMELAGYSFRIRLKEIDEVYPEQLKSSEVAEYLAIKKAEAQKEMIESDSEVIIAADSVVISRGKVLGKPGSPEEAFTMIHELAGESHAVISGVCLLGSKKKQSFSVESRVFFQDMDKGEITHYIEQYQPFDKAGSYGIQEWIGLNFIEKIEGSYTNIMGLPMQALYQALREW